MASSDSGSGGGGRLCGPADGDDGAPRPLIRGRVLEQIKLNATQMHTLRMQVEYLVAVTRSRQRTYGNEGANPAVAVPEMSAAAVEAAVAAARAGAAAARAAAAGSVNEAESSGENKHEAAEATAPAAPEK